MARRIWIVPRKDQIEQSNIDAAIASNCPEIVNGIPPALSGIINEASLPMAYEEPESPAPKPIIDPIAKILELEKKIKELETRLGIGPE